MEVVDAQIERHYGVVVAPAAAARAVAGAFLGAERPPRPRPGGGMGGGHRRRRERRVPRLDPVLSRRGPAVADVRIVVVGLLPLVAVVVVVVVVAGGGGGRRRGNIPALFRFRFCFASEDAPTSLSSSSPSSSLAFPALDAASVGSGCTDATVVVPLWRRPHRLLLPGAEVDGRYGDAIDDTTGCCNGSLAVQWETTRRTR